MKFCWLAGAIAVVAVPSSSSSSVADAQALVGEVVRKKAGSNSNKLAKEEETDYWSRYLQYNVISLPPNPAPTQPPSLVPTPPPTLSPTVSPVVPPSSPPTTAPSTAPTPLPTIASTTTPTTTPTTPPTPSPSTSPTTTPTPSPSSSPTVSPTIFPTPLPSTSPTVPPAPLPTPYPTVSQTAATTSSPTPLPTISPTPAPTSYPTPPLTVFPTSAPTNPLSCIVAVNASCASQSGVPCTALEPPEGQCSIGKLFVYLRFTYQATKCDKTRNAQGSAASCRDFDSGPKINETAVIACTGPNGTTLFDSTALTPGSSFVVEAPTGGTLPIFVTCGVTTPDATPLQLNTFDISGGVNLFLKNQFGSFELEACTNSDFQTKDCTLDISYDYALSNVGPVPLEINLFDIKMNSGSVSLLSFVPQKSLAPGKTTDIAIGNEIDACVPKSYQLQSSVGASPPAGAQCFASSNYSFDINVGCSIFLQSTCQVVKGGDDCSTITGESQLQCGCSDCAREIIFRYTGTLCNSAAIGKSGLISCTDSNGGPTDNALVVVSNGNVEYYRDTVAIGDDLIVTHFGDCLPDTLTLTVSEPSSTNVLQSVAIDTSCSQGPGSHLLTFFGALDFTGYTCKNDAVSHNCYVDVTYTYDARNIGLVDLSIATLRRTLNGQSINLLTLQPNAIVLVPATDFTAQEFVQIERCTSTQYSVTSTITATGPLETPTCNSTDQLIYDLTVGSLESTPSPTPLSTPAPTAKVITSSPSAIPFTNNPSATQFTDYPSATPATNSPTATPATDPPTATPFALTTSTPSAGTATASPIIPSTISPTKFPSAMPFTLVTTPAPTPFTQFPSPLPPPPSSSPPTSPPGPGYSCLLDLNLNCEPPEGATSCDTIPPVVTQCLQRPTEITMVLYGGKCSQSFNNQNDTLFRCFDYNGGPPTSFGSQVYIVVTDTKGAGIVYFSGSATVGDTYVLKNNGKQLEASMNITIYSSSDTSPSNILETLVYYTSCSHDLFLSDRFGASHLVQFVNDAQGVVSLFQIATYEFSIKFPLTLSGNAILTSLVSVTDFGVFNFTKRIIGLNVSSGQEVIISQPVEFDLSQRRRYTAVTTLTGVSPSGQLCTATDVTSFVAGNPTPPVIPTMAPSGVPGGLSPAPTTNPLTSPCRLRAFIKCSIPQKEATSCKSIFAPVTTACSGNSPPSYLQFRYLGGNNFPDQVYISITQGQTFFQGIVNKFGFVNAYGNFEVNSVPVVVSDVVNGQSGSVLATIDVPTTCTGSDLILYNTYGDVLQLSAFANNVAGLVNGFAAVQVDYFLQNNGDSPVNVTDVSVNSAFSGNNSLIRNPLTIPGRGRVILGNETAVIHLQSAKTSNAILRFTLHADGTAAGTGYPCVDVDRYSISVK